MSVNPAIAQRSKSEGYFMARWTFLIATLMVTSPVVAQPQNWLVGTWKLVSAAALPGSLRHPVSGRDPQEGDDDDRDSSFWWDRFRPGWTHVAQAQARRGVAPVAG